MPWFVLLTLALGLAIGGRWFTRQEEVYGLALYSAAGLSGLWGWAIAPPPVQLSVGVLGLAWVQLRSRPQRG